MELAAVELDDELVALLDEPLRHAGGDRIAETIIELVFPSFGSVAAARSANIR